MQQESNYTIGLNEVAMELKVCERTIRNRLKARGPVAPEIARKIGRYWRFSSAVFNSVIALPG